MRPLRRTLFQLAETLHRPVSEIESTVDSAELSEWIAYWNIYPKFDPWLAMGIICSTLNGLLSSKSKKPSDFFPFTSGLPKVRKQSVKEMKAVVGGVLSAFRKKTGGSNGDGG